MWVKDLRATGPEPVPQSAPGGVGRCHPARRPPQPQPHRLASPPLRPWRGSPPLRQKPPCSLASPGLPPPAGPPIPRRRSQTRPAASSPGRGGPAARCKPRARSPAPVCGSGTAPALPAARSSSSSSSNAGGPGISPTARPRGRLSGRLPSVRQSLLLPYAASAAPRRLLLSARRFGQTSARLLVRTRRSGHGNTILPACAPACAAVAAASQQQQQRQPCGTAGPGSRAPAAMMGCVM